MSDRIIFVGARGAKSYPLSMKNFSITIFVSAPATAKVTGHYVCLVRGKSGEPDTYYSDDSLVDLAGQLGDKVGDWNYVEHALREKGVWYD
jgi:hypothetical protein